MQSWMEDEYACGSKGSVKRFVTRPKSRSRDSTKRYYCSNNGPKGGRIRTKYICSICYSEDDIVTREEIIKSRDVGFTKCSMVPIQSRLQ